jgi:indole-3-glycerol phosphate synthase
MKRELDSLVEMRRQQEIERDKKLNMVEFSLNKRSLKELGVVDKVTMDQYYNQ